ncbi:hypothetical protein D9M71_645380 [compost metagenome]
MNFDPVHARADGVTCRAAIVADDRLDALEGQFLRDWNITPDAIALIIDNEGLTGNRQGARRDRQCAIGLEGRMGDATDMPQLHEDRAGAAVNGLADRLPGPDLFFAVDARGPGVALALSRDLRGLGDDEGRAGALPVILDIHFGRYIARLAGTGACQWGHGHPVLQGGSAQRDRLKKMSAQGVTP